jgi:HSP20 family molecular chaperone IbpA
VRPAADIIEAEGGVRIMANMPGVRAEDLHVLQENGWLHIWASSHCPRPDITGNDLRNLEFGNVEYQLDIAMEAPLSSPPPATLEGGVLSVLLPVEHCGKVRFT